MENNAVVVSDNSPTEMIKLAIDKGADLDKLEKLLALKREHDKDLARQAYHKAMALFKANPPKIDKDRTVSFDTSKGKTIYNHATLANVTEKINSGLSKYGLSASWRTQQNGKIIVTCKITHELGHSEETSLSADPDTSGSKNPIQAIGSTITYLERYTLLALTGLATDEQDDDGKSSGPAVEKITDKDISGLRDTFILLENLGGNPPDVTEANLIKFLNISSLEEMPVSMLPNAKNALETKRKKLTKGNK